MSKPTPRPYQRQDLVAIRAKLKEHRRVLYVLPTGGGKTVVAGNYIEQNIRAGQRGLVLVHSGELLEQMVATLQRFGLEPHEIGVIWQDDKRTNPTSPMQVATVQTLTKRAKPRADFVVVDEADLSLTPMWVKNIDGWYRDAKILGLTATPFRLDRKPMSDAFDVMVPDPPRTVQELIDTRDDAGRPALLAPRCFVPVRERLIDTDGVKIEGGDWQQAELEKRACATWTLAGVSRWMRALGEDRNGFVFACGVKHIQKLVEQINADKRFQARPLSRATPKSERRDMLRPGGWLETGKRRVVVTCDVVSRGYDLPAAKLVVMARPTCSEALYRHQVGRILRPTTKNEFQPLVLDLTRNVLRFGRPQDPRDKPLSLEAEPVMRGLAKTNPAPKAKQCETCGTIAALGATACEQCGAEFPARSPTEVAGALVEYVPMACATCGQPATRQSSRSARRRGHSAYCDQHALTNQKRMVPIIPCATCGQPATRQSSRSARRRGTNAYCDQHALTNQKRMVPLLPCATCGQPATRQSSTTARRRGGKAYCDQHAVTNQKRMVPLLPCATCGQPANRQSSRSARRRGGKAYCDQHAVTNQKRMVPLLPCATCGQPATENSSRRARREGMKAYCLEHPKRRRDLLPCATCGQPATLKSSHDARHKGHNAYCTEHPGGHRPPAEVDRLMKEEEKS